MITPVPTEVLAVVEAVNKELISHSGQKIRGKLVPYLQDRELDEPDWRCHLVDAEGNTLASHLHWKHLEWHTVSMFLHGFEEQAERNVRLGLQQAAEAMHKHNQRILGLIR